ncbi:unnamed protein product, partial [Rotaria socialis]
MVLSNCDIQSLAKSTAALSQTLAHAVQAKTTNANSQVQVNTIRHLSDGTLALDYQCTAVADLEAAKMALNNAVQRDDIKNAIALRTIVVASEAGEKSQQNKSLYTASEPAFKPSKLGESESTDSDAKQGEFEAPKQPASPSPKSDVNHEITRGPNRREGDQSGGEQMREASKAPGPAEYGNPGDDHKGGPLSGPKPGDAGHLGDDHKVGLANGPKPSEDALPGDDHNIGASKGRKQVECGLRGGDHDGGEAKGPQQCDGGHPGDDHNGGEPIGTKQAEGTQPNNNQKGGAINAPTQSAGGQPGDDQEERASKEYKPHETTKKSETSDNGKKSELTKQGTLDGDPTETVRQGPVITGAATHGDDKTKFGTTDSRKMGESTKAGAAGGRNTGAATYPGGITVGTAGVGFTTTAAAQSRQTWDLGSQESGERVLTTKAGAQGG